MAGTKGMICIPPNGKALNLRYERILKGIGLVEFAEYMGVSRQWIHSIETGKRKAGAEFKSKAAEFFGKKEKYLFTLTSRKLVRTYMKNMPVIEIKKKGGKKKK